MLWRQLSKQTSNLGKLSTCLSVQTAAFVNAVMQVSLSKSDTWLSMTYTFTDNLLWCQSRPGQATIARKQRCLQDTVLLDETCADGQTTGIAQQSLKPIMPAAIPDSSLCIEKNQL